MKIVSVIPSFPDNSIVIGKAVSFFDDPNYDYKVYCWSSSNRSWSFWAKYLKGEYRKHVVLSAIKSVRSLKGIGILLEVLGFVIGHNKLFRKHRKQFAGKGLRAYLVALLDDYRLMKLNPDILHFEFGTFALNKVYLKEVLGCKVVTSFRGYDINYFKLDVPDVYSPVWKSVDGFHFLGKDLMSRAEKRGFDGTNKVIGLVPPAIYPELFTRSIPIKKETSLRPITIISVGRVVWKKGVSFGLLAFKQFLDEGGNGEYHIVGDGPSMEEIRFTAFELGIEHKVKLYGRLKPEETKEKLEQADVFLHPSISEGFCNAVIEAQAMEIPVVCTDADGLGENIVDTETGYLVPKWDTNIMANRLLKLYREPELRYELGKNGRARVLNNFTVPIQAKQFADFYQRVYES